jgi:hypothetical protein
MCGGVVASIDTRGGEGVRITRCGEKEMRRCRGLFEERYGDCREGQSMGFVSFISGDWG